MKSWRWMLLGVMGLALTAAIACGGGGASATATPTPRPGATATPTPTTGGEAATVNVLLKDANNVYAFAPDKFTFEAGKSYKLVLKTEDQPHTFTIKDLNVDVQILAPRETKEFTFTPTKKGTFRLVCQFHEALGQVGTVDVK